MACRKVLPPISSIPFLREFVGHLSLNVFFFKLASRQLWYRERGTQCAYRTQFTAATQFVSSIRNLFWRPVFFGLSSPIARRVLS